MSMSPDHRFTGWRPRAPEGLPRVHRGVVRTCGPQTADCKHDPKGDHGWHQDELHLLVRVADPLNEVVTDLTLYTVVLDGVIERMSCNTYRAAYASWIAEHTNFTLTEEHVRQETSPQPCAWVSGAQCYSTEPRSSRGLWTPEDDLALEPFLVEKDLHEKAIDLTSGIWSRLEAHALASFQELVADHRALPLRCSTCHGTGLVPRAP